MKKLPLFLLIIVAACTPPEDAAEPEPAVLKIDPSRVTVSGLSSGAYMAGQLHVAHSSRFAGAAILAGGPYSCAQGSMTQAVGPCVKGGEIDVPALIANARGLEASGVIDPLGNLADDRVWLFHASLDDAVNKDVVRAAQAFYGELTDEERIEFIDDVQAVHGMPTLETGADCSAMEAPYVNACGYDTAGELLQYLYGELRDRTAAQAPLQKIKQQNHDDAELLEHALLYVPAACRGDAECGLHVAFHGCMQSTEYVGDAFALGAGYNEWAESNDLVVLYPQVASSKVAPMNPLGCWDWWGYTGENYANREGKQIASVIATIDALIGTPD